MESRKALMNLLQEGMGTWSEDSLAMGKMQGGMNWESKCCIIYTIK